MYIIDKHKVLKTQFETFDSIHLFDYKIIYWKIIKHSGAFWNLLEQYRIFSEIHTCKIILTDNNYRGVNQRRFFVKYDNIAINL